MSKTFWMLAVLWIAVLLPGMIAGGLWSGHLPLWPPVQSPHLHDRVIWGALFVASYGIPILLVILIVRKRRQGRPRRLQE